MVKLVDIGDGRIIEMLEPGEEPPALPAKRPRIANPGTKPGRKKTSEPRYKRKTDDEAIGRRGRTGQERRHVPGYVEWLSLRSMEMAQFRNKPGFSSWKRSNVPDGMRKEDAEKAWEEARRKARIDMANLKKAGVVDETDARAEEALLATLEVMRSPMNQDHKLKAARQVLEWTKAKPVAKSEVTVNAAEAWLASIADQTSTEE